MGNVLTPASEMRQLSMSQAKKLPVGGRIRWARARRNLSHDALAAQVNSSRSYLIRVEKGQHMPSPEFRARLAVATRQSVDFFQNEDEDEEDAELARELIFVLRRLMDGRPA